MKRIAPVMVATMMLLAASACSSTSPLESAVASCELEGHPHATIGDGGSSLTLRTVGKLDVRDQLKMLNGDPIDEQLGITFDQMGCIQDELTFPDHVRSRMNSTRALDGTQTESWDNLQATWSYHPDSGANIIIAGS